jgi:hypothetical protein
MTPWAVSVASTFLPALTTGWVTLFRFGMWPPLSDLTLCMATSGGSLGRGDLLPD